jgi:hypothetical protein
MSLQSPLPPLPQFPVPPATADIAVQQWAADVERWGNQLLSTVQNWARLLTAHSNQNFTGAVEIGQPTGGMPGGNGTLNAEALLVQGVPVLVRD